MLGGRQTHHTQHGHLVDGCAASAGVGLMAEEFEICAALCAIWHAEDCLLTFSSANGLNNRSLPHGT